jgi:hypothetical protein
VPYELLPFYKISPKAGLICKTSWASNNLIPNNTNN